MDSLNLWRCLVTNASANACLVCGDPLPNRPPSQRLKYCSRTCAGQAKQKLPTVKVCSVCQSEFTPTTRYQAARNKTCSPACAAMATSTAKKGVTRVPDPICRHCGETFKPKSNTEKSRAKYCSTTCWGHARSGDPIHRQRMRDISALGVKALEGKPRVVLKGAKNPAWKGGVTYKRPKGNYIGPRYVRCPPEFASMARSDGYVMEHRLVMARWIGRPLTRIEVVNHKDHNPRNNVRSNLELYPTNGDHKRGEVGRFVPGVANRLSLPG